MNGLYDQNLDPWEEPLHDCTDVYVRIYPWAELPRECRDKLSAGGDERWLIVVPGTLQKPWGNIPPSISSLIEGADYHREWGHATMLEKGGWKYITCGS